MAQMCLNVILLMSETMKAPKEARTLFQKSLHTMSH